MLITGSKSGSGGGSGDTSNNGTEIASVAYMKMLLALSEGEVEGGVTGKHIFMNGTPLIDDNGVENFPGVTWEFRNGTQDQPYIKGFPAVENEIAVGFDMKYGTPWVKSVSNTQLSAVRIRVKFANGVYSMRESGGKDGYRIEYAVEISTDGSTYKEVGRDAADGIANTGYERSYRIDLPAAVNGWQIRVRRLTAEKNDGRTAEAMRIESMTEIVDAKLSYPNTALLFIQFDSKLFDGQTPTVTVLMKGIRVRVPANYDPIARTYNGAWDGTFKFAWTNNVVWQIYDLLLKGRYGTGKRLSAEQIDKWSLYKIAQYQDAQVSDGMGGKEVRSMFDVYITSRPDVWQVLMDMVNSFQGMIGWSNNLLTIDADMPRSADPDFVFSKANIVGSFAYSGSSERANYSAGICTFSNPENHFSDDQASAFVADLVRRYGFNQLEMTAVGCTRESEAQRRLLWAVLTNSNDNLVEFTTGQEGRIPRLGKIIGVNNAPLAGRSNGGRISAAAGTKITVDRDVQAKSGDRLIVNLPSGIAQSREVKSVSGRGITVDSPFSETPASEASWVLDQTDLAIELYRVSSITENDDRTITIAGIPYDPNKFPRIDDGAIIEDRPVTVVPPRGQSMPKNIKITSSYRVEQGIGITRMEVSWQPAENAIAYEAQWRQDNGNWINAGRTGNTLFSVDGIYSGRYVVRVRAINALDIASMWATSSETKLNGKTGRPAKPVALKTTSKVFGVYVTWAFPAGAEDSQKTVLQYTYNSDGSNPMFLSDVPFPQRTFEQTGLKAGLQIWYRAKLVDKSGNESDFTEWVKGETSSDAGEILSYLTGKINETQLSKDLLSTIDDKATKAEVENATSEALNSANKNVSDARKEAAALVNDAKKQASSLIDAESQKRIQADATETESRISAVKQEAAARADALLSERNSRTADINLVKTLIQTGDESLARQVSQIAAGTGEQFDSFKIWHFDTNSAEGWTGQGSPSLTSDGWLRPANHATDPYVTSPSGIAASAGAYRFIKLRVKKQGNPGWAGQLRWSSAGQAFSDKQMLTVEEPAYDANGVATLTIHDINWNSAGTIDRIRLDLTNKQDDNNFIQFDWIAVGRPTPGAGMSALQEEAEARVNADAAEAKQRNTLAVQMRGSYEGTDVEKVSSGLIFSERAARIAADKVEVSARESLQAKIDGNFSDVTKSIDAITGKAETQAREITALKSGLAGKADTVALTALQSSVKEQDGKITSNAGTLADLKASVGQMGDNMDNMIINPSFENGLFIWQVDNPSAVSVSVSDSAVGKQSLKIASASSFAGVTQTVSRLKSGRTYQVSCQYKFSPDAVIADAGNTKVRIGDAKDLLQSVLFELTDESKNTWSTCTISFTPDRDRVDVLFGFRALLSKGFILIDDIIVSDISDAQAISAQAKAIESLQSNVVQSGKDISSVSTSVNQLKNTLDNTNSIVAKKADSSALNALQNSVAQQGKEISAGASNVTELKSALNKRTTFVLRSTGLGSSGTMSGVYDENGKTLISVTRSYILIVFNRDSDGSTSIRSYKSYDIYTSSGNGNSLATDIKALSNGTYAAIITYDEPSANKESVSAAVELLGGTAEMVSSIVYRGAYILIGRKGMKPGDGLELTSPTGGKSDSSISTSVEFIDGVMTGLGSAGGVMMKSDAIAKATDALATRVKTTEDGLESSGKKITALENSVRNATDTLSKKADSSALNSLSSTVSNQGNTLASQGNRVTSLENTFTTGDNIVPNSQMLNNAQGWAGNSTTVDGYQAVSSSSAWQPSSARFPVTPGDIIDISLMCVSGSAVERLTWGIRFDGPSVTNVVQYISNQNVKAGEKKRFAGSVTVPAGAATGLLQANGVSSLLTLYNVDVTRRNAGVVSNSAAIDTLSSVVSQQGDKIASSSSKISSLENSINSVNSAVSKKADASALTSLTNRVTKTEDSVESQGASLANLNNSINSVNSAVSKKADASALTSLTNRVTKTEDSVESQSSSLTNLNNSFTSLSASGTNIWFDGTLETYADNQVLTGDAIVVTSPKPYAGSKCLMVRRFKNTYGNSDKDLGPSVAVKAESFYRIELWAMMPSEESPSSGWSVAVGVHCRSASGGHSWQQAFDIRETSIKRGVWTKFSGIASTKDAVTAQFWVSCRGDKGNDTPGYNIYFDTITVSEITDAKAAQESADANASATQALTNRVSKTEGSISSVSQSVSTLTSKVNENTSSINSVSNSVSDLKQSTSKEQTTLKSQINDTSAQLQTTAQTLNNLKGQVSSSYAVKVGITAGGAYYGAGFGIGLTNETGQAQSQFLVAADKFAVLASSDGSTASSASSPFAVTNGQVFMNTAFIRDGSITNAKIGNAISSSNYSPNVSGWLLDKNGNIELNGSGSGGGRMVIRPNRIVSIHPDGSIAVVFGEKL